MLTYPYFLYVLVLNFTLSLFCVSWGHAEIYTYEKDGVIVISTEPPPQPLRRKKVRRNKARKTSRKKRNTKALKKKKRSSRITIRPAKFHKPRLLRKIKKELRALTKTYLLPLSLTTSLISACYHLKREFKSLNKTKFKSITCLSEPVTKNLIDSQSKNKKVNKRTHHIADNIEPGLWLLRRLLNFYRGDVTLALSAYYMVGQSQEALTYVKSTSIKRDLDYFMNNEESDKEARQKRMRLLVPNREAQRFTQIFLYLYHQHK